MSLLPLTLSSAVIWRSLSRCTTRRSTAFRTPKHRSDVATRGCLPAHDSLAHVPFVLAVRAHAPRRMARVLLPTFALKSLESFINS